MSTIQRPLAGTVLTFELGEERKLAVDAGGKGGRSGRTLLKEGSLRVTLVVLEPGGELHEHHAEGPIIVQPLEGRIHFTADGHLYDLGPGELLAARAGVRHSVRSPGGGTFLLTISLAHHDEAGRVGADDEQAAAHRHQP
jgi:quercetin dioxygenase-like cupin family protein